MTGRLIPPGVDPGYHKHRKLRNLSGNHDEGGTNWAFFPGIGTTKRFFEPGEGRIPVLRIRVGMHELKMALDAGRWAGVFHRSGVVNATGG